MTADAAARAFDRLGLGIVRDLVRAHGGEVTIESRPEAGTTSALPPPSLGVSGVGGSAVGSGQWPEAFQSTGR